MNQLATPASVREAQVWAALEGVSDPELDESVIELGFVTGVEVDAEGAVDISFRLPTYWCSANFAFIMADDMRSAARALPWVTRVAVRLADHMDDAKINHGIAHGLSFDQTFGAEGDGSSLDEVRQIFAVKAFQRRQEKLLRHLLAAEHAAEDLVGLSVAQLVALQLDAEGQALRLRYLERRSVVAPDAPELRYLERRSVVAPDAPEASVTAFVDKVGSPIKAAALPGYLRVLRGVSINTDFGGALCRGLLVARYGSDSADAPPIQNVQPIHFMRSAAALPG